MTPQERTELITRLEGLTESCRRFDAVIHKLLLNDDSWYIRANGNELLFNSAVQGILASGLWNVTSANERKEIIRHARLMVREAYNNDPNLAQMDFTRKDTP